MSDVYTPKVIVEDIEAITEEEWRRIRTHYIGGSDAAKLFGDSSWSTMRELFWTKTGQRQRMPQDEEENWVGKEVGHRLEELVLKIFRKKNPGWVPYTVRKMFQHRDYPWMMANCDAFVQDPRTGQIYVVEVKTTSPYALNIKWGDKDSNVIPRDYEWQGRHYMAVTGAAGVIYVVLGGFTEDTYRQRVIMRDMEIEKELIEKEDEFWNNYVVPGIEPPLFEDPGQVVEALKKHYWKDDSAKEPVILPKSLAPDVAKILQLKEEQSELNRQAREKKKQEDALWVSVLDALKGQDGEITLDDGVYSITQTVKTRKSVPSDVLPSLRLSNPDIYGQFVKVSESLSQTIKKK